MVKRGLLSNEVANEIKQFIIENRLKKGDRIPNETRLSQELDVSRITIREAIKILSASGIVQIKRGVGTFICDKPGVVLDPLGLAFLDSTLVKDQLQEARLLIEPLVIEEVVKNITDEEIIELEKLHNEMMGHIEKYKQGHITRKIASKRYADYEIAFHTRLAKCSKNEILERIIYIIMEAYIKRYWEKDFIPTAPDYGSFHQALIETLKEKNLKKARNEMKNHIENAETWKLNHTKKS